MQNIQLECLQLREDFPTFEKACENAAALLPKEPMLLVNSYLNSNPQQPKEVIVASKHSCFTMPALPEPQTAFLISTFQCSCLGKCATRRCICKQNLCHCQLSCSCKNGKCSNQ